MDINSTNRTGKANASSKRKIERWEIGWYVLFILGPAAFIGPVVALLFAFYFAVPDYSFFLILAILGIILYVLTVFFLVRAWIKAGNPNTKPGHIDASALDSNPGPKLNAGVIGIAFLHGLFGGRKKSGSDTAWSDLYWQEKYRHQNY